MGRRRQIDHRLDGVHSRNVNRAVIVYRLYVKQCPGWGFLHTLIIYRFGDYSLWMTARVFWAAISQSKSSLCAKALARKISANTGLLRIVSIALAMAEILYGLISRAPSPATSGIDEVAEVTTGIPQDIASNTGRPKPSKNDG